MKNTDLFLGPGPKEVKLNRPPLAKVLCQISFPGIVSIADKSFIAPFQEAIRQEYPIITQEQGLEFAFTDKGGSFHQKTIWRMEDEARIWRISLGEQFLALETTNYPGRTKFLDVLSFVVKHVHSIIKPGQVNRIGLRFINRMSFPGSQELSKLMNPQLMGAMNQKIESIVDSLLTELQLSADEYMKVRGRWGLVPENTTIDPTILTPVEYHSWILDIDGISFQVIPFDSELIIPICQRLGDLDYRFFRYSVTDDFLTMFGGVM